MWTRAYPCTEQGRAERCATEWSVREHRLFEQLPRTWLRMPFWARLRAFMPSLLRSFASLRPRGRTNPNSLSTSSQYRSKYTWEIHSKIIEKSIQNRWKSVLGAMLAQDDTSLEPSWPKMTPRIDFSSIFHHFGGSKMHKKSIQKQSNFQTSLETLFSANRVHKSSKMRVQNHSKMEPFLGRVKNRESCSRLHADLVFEV